jgi:hypothetical protein
VDRGVGSRLLADVELPGGGVVQVRAVEGADGLGSAGLGERLHLDDALSQIGALATIVRTSSTSSGSTEPMTTLRCAPGTTSPSRS